MVNQVISNISTGYWIKSLKTAEDTDLLNFAWIGSWFLQTHQMSYALTFAQAALNVVGSTKAIPITYFHCQIASAVAILYCKTIDPQNRPNLHNIGRFIHNHLGTASQLVVLVSSVALAFFGQQIGGFTAAWVAFGFFERAGMLDLPILGSAISYLGIGSNIIETIFEGDWISRSILIGILAPLILDYTTNYGKAIEGYEIPETELTKRSILDIDSFDLNLDKLKVSFAHINVVQKIFDAPEISNDQILTDFENLKNESQFSVEELEKALKDVERFTHRTDQKIDGYEFLKVGLTCFVMIPEKREKSSDENVLKLTKMSKHALYYISKLDKDTKIKKLIEMGIWAYDASLYEQKIQALYYLATEKHPDLTLANKLYRYFDTCRAELYVNSELSFFLNFTKEDAITYRLGLPWKKIFARDGIPDVMQIYHRAECILARQVVWREYTPRHVNILYGVKFSGQADEQNWHTDEFEKDYKLRYSKEPSDDEIQAFLRKFYTNMLRYRLFLLTKLGILE